MRMWPPSQFTVLICAMVYTLYHLSVGISARVYDWMYGKASFLWHGSFLQIISVLGGLQKWLSYENHSHNFAERSVEKKIDFFPVKLPKTVRERKKIEKNSLKSFPLFFSPKIKLEFLNKFLLKKKSYFADFFILPLIKYPWKEFLKFIGFLG